MSTIYHPLSISILYVMQLIGTQVCVTWIFRFQRKQPLCPTRWLHRIGQL